MTNSDNITNQSVQDPNAQLSTLADEAKEVNAKIDETNRSASEEMDGLAKSVDDSVGKADTMYADLDHAEQEAGDEFDALALERAEDLASE